MIPDPQYRQEEEMLFIGTSGFSYDDWVGPFYPEGMAKREFLHFYAGEFSTVELNVSYYRLPDAKFISTLSDKTPDGFEFFVKAYRGLTHKITGSTPAELRLFKQALGPLRAEGKLAGALVQFPYSYHRTDSNLEHLSSLLDELREFTPVVEFRNREWLTDDVLSLLSDKDAGFCSVDQPGLRGLLPSDLIITTPRVGYVRFHGRNREKWWDHKEAWERYDYLYSEDELAEWARKIREAAGKTGKTFLFFNNHRNGQAVRNARQMKLLLEDFS